MRKTKSTKRTIFESLYHGKISVVERPAITNPKRDEINKRIETETAYFKERMPATDHLRFDDLEELFLRLNDDMEVDIFTYGFTLGVMLMQEVSVKGGEYHQ